MAKARSGKKTLISIEPTEVPMANEPGLPSEPVLKSEPAAEALPAEHGKALQVLENKLKRKDVLLQEQQKKIRILKERIARLDEELREKNRAIYGYQADLVEVNRSQEQKQTVIDNLKNQLQDLLNEIAETQHQYQEAVSREEAYKVEITRLNERLRALEKENNGLRAELKQKHQDYVLAAKEVKETRRIYRELQESFDQLLAQNNELEQRVSDLTKIKEELDSRYTRTLENIKVEFRQKQGESSRLLKELHEVKGEKEELERLMDGLELKIEMLHSTNASLQRKLDKLNQQKATLEEKLSHPAVQFVLNLIQFQQKYLGQFRRRKNQKPAGLSG